MSSTPATATGWLRDLVATHGDSPAVVIPDGETVSFAELDHRVARLAGGLRQAGLGRGDRMASFVANGVLPVELLLAAGRLGAVTIGVNTRFRAGDLRHVLERGRPRLLVAASGFLGIDFHRIVADASEGLAAPPDVLWPADVDALRGAAGVEEDAAGPDDLLVAFTTSGTTGRPKLAAHDHGSSVRQLRAVARSTGVDPTAVGLLTLPFCGTFGFVSALAVLSGGGRVVVMDHFQPAAAARLVARHRVTHLNASDDMILAMLEGGPDLSSWRQGVVAEFTGRAVEAARRAEAVGARLTGVYGSSETFALLARWDPSDPIEIRARSGGVLVDPANECRVVEGELQLRGPSVLQAFLVEDGTAPPPLVEGGWLPTGDLAVADPSGGFVYLARMGDALRLRGFLTDPSEIEQHLLAHPDVDGAQVVGAPGADGGDVAVAFVTTSAPVAEADLLAWCRAGLANYKVPARVVTVGAFPTVDGPNGVKIRKGDLRREAAALLG